VEFENTFTVKAPVDEVYEALLDLERVTPAMPGAQVLEQTGEGAYKVAIKVKLGPVSMTYRGDVTIVERDPEKHSAVLDVKAKEARGQGSAKAKVSMSLEPDGEGTRGAMQTSVQLSGKAAAMSRGVIDDVSKRLVATFAQNLEAIVAAPDAGDAEAPAPGPAAAPKPSADADDGLRVAPIAASMAADRMRDPRVLAAVVGGALLAGWLIGRRS
jgi:carbon monoxide dehydrogenase subunit G